MTSERKDGPIKCTWHLGTQEKSPHDHYRNRKTTGIMETILENIGETPLVRINKIGKDEGITCDIVAKCEFFNAGGSVKDRIGYRMVVDAEKSGRIKPGDTLIEPTSGNTGIGLALAAAVKGYKMIITLPEKMSQEKVNTLKALGAIIYRTPTEAAFDAPESHIGVAKKLNAEIPNSHILDQYKNPANPLAHYDGTAEEIFEQTGGKVDLVVVGAGTGGTITGIARKLKEKIPNVKVVGIDPFGSILAVPESLNTNLNTPYQVEGIGYDFIPTVLDRDPGLIDFWVKSSDKESFQMSRRLIREEGLLCGGSSGSAMACALKAIKHFGLKEGQRCVVILPDSVRNYMSKFLDDEWMKKGGFTSDAMKVEETQDVEQWKGATIKDLNLPAAVCVNSKSSCKECLDTMNEGGFDQVPVVDDSNKLIGLVTIGSLLSKLSKGRVAKDDKISEAMFQFSTTKAFKEINEDTKLADLRKFFDNNSAAFVTDKQTKGVKHVVTKVDLVKWLMKN